jgi:hypothetical protein
VVNWRLISAVGFGTYLGLTAGYWLEFGRVADRPSVCVEWSRGGAQSFCTGWSE